MPSAIDQQRSDDQWDRRSPNYRIGTERQYSRSWAIAVMPTELWKLPVPATSLVRGPDFGILPKRQCEISFHIERDDRRTVRVSLLFEGIVAFKCTYLTSITTEMFNTAYAKLVRLGKTAWLTELLKARASHRQRAEELQHLMICFDDGPCFEIVCLSFTERRSE